MGRDRGVPAWLREPCCREASDRRITGRRRPGLACRDCQGRCGGPAESGERAGAERALERLCIVVVLTGACSGRPGRRSAEGAEPTVLTETAVGQSVPATLMGQHQGLPRFSAQRPGTWQLTRRVWLQVTEHVGRGQHRAAPGALRPGGLRPPPSLTVPAVRGTRGPAGQGPGGAECPEGGPVRWSRLGGFIFAAFVLLCFPWRPGLLTAPWSQCVVSSGF